MLGGIFAGQFLFVPVERDARMCPVSGPFGIDIVVIDKSDEWNNSQKVRLRNVISTFKYNIEKDRLLAIFVFSDFVEFGFQPLFSICSPGQGNETNELIGNPRRQQQAFNQSFEQPLNDILTELAEPNSGNNSPILEILSDIVSRIEYRSINGPKRIILISDMIQNSELLSLFREDGSKVDITPIIQNVAGSHFSRFSFDIRQIRGRFSEAQLNNAKHFWERWAMEQDVEMNWSTF